MRINNFLGGINTRYLPNLIPDNACQYAENVNLASGSLTNIKALKKVQDATDSKPYYYKGNWSFHNKNSTFTEAGEILYIADGGIIKKSIDGKTIYNLVIDAPIYAPTVVAQQNDGNVGGEGIQYCYTYYNENDGSESAPSAFSTPIKVGDWTTTESETYWGGSKVIEVGNLIQSKDPQVTHIRVYRRDATMSNYKLVNQLKNENAITLDNMDSNTLANMPALATYGFNVKVPTNLTPPYAADFVVAYEGTIFATGTGKNANWVYNSESYSPYLWGTGATKFDEKVVGLGATRSGIIVFCETKTYILYGSVGSFSKQLLLPSTGCINKHSIANHSSGCIWQATDGYYSFSNGLQNITYEKLVYDNLLPILDSTVDDEAYYALQENGKILVINFRLNLAIYYFNSDNAKGIRCALGKLFVCDGKELKTYAGDNANIVFKSKQYIEAGLSMYKNYKIIYVYSEGNLQFRAYIDDRLVADVPLKDKGVTEVKVHQPDRTGYYIWFEIEGYGSVKEIEFISEARQNGR